MREIRLNDFDNTRDRPLHDVRVMICRALVAVRHMLSSILPTLAPRPLRLESHTGGHLRHWRGESVIAHLLEDGLWRNKRQMVLDFKNRAPGPRTKLQALVCHGASVDKNFVPGA